jgi:hypothetical protein
MRDAEEICHFPIRQAASHHRSRTQDSPGSDSFSTDLSRTHSGGGAIRSIGSKLSLQRGAKFREGMGNGLRLRITRNDGHKPKTRKGNQIMKNRNIQFKATAGLLIPLLLACFAAVFISAPTPAAARDMVPFNGTVSGYVDSQSGTECEPSIHVINFGHANQLGAFTGTAEFFPRPANPTRIFVKIISPTLAPLTGLRPTATKFPALSRGTCARQKRRSVTTTMKPRG